MVSVLAQANFWHFSQQRPRHCFSVHAVFTQEHGSVCRPAIVVKSFIIYIHSVCCYEDQIALVYIGNHSVCVTSVVMLFDKEIKTIGTNISRYSNAAFGNANPCPQCPCFLLMLCTALAPKKGQRQVKSCDFARILILPVSNLQKEDPVR